jgi:hypothetical protein
MSLDIELYKVSNESFPIVSAKKQRNWMNDNVHAYRCVPLSIANTFGWDIFLPKDLDVEWNGRNQNKDLKIYENAHLYESHFGSGTFTIQVAYTWKTSEDYQIMVMPYPNPDQYDIVSLTAIVETDRLMYPWFLTCKVTRPGRYKLKAGTPIARVIPIKVKDTVDCNINLTSEPKEYREYREWQADMRNKIDRTKEDWQKFYHKVARWTSVITPKIGRK